VTLDDLKLHDAILTRADIGPRREVRLDLLFPTSDQRSVNKFSRVSVRFGAIENYVEVEQFFSNRSSMPEWAAGERVDALRRTAEGWLLELDDSGRFVIATSKTPTVAVEGD
jgi:hypothetical protein